MTTIMTLRELDSEVWQPGSARLVQKYFQPQGSNETVIPEHGSICYRSVYYY